SLEHPTLELRAPDCCTLVEDTIAIAALYRVLARYLTRNPLVNQSIGAVERAIAVENKWRAQRYGVHGTFVSEIGAVSVARCSTNCWRRSRRTPPRSAAWVSCAIAAPSWAPAPRPIRSSRCSSS